MTSEEIHIARALATVNFPPASNAAKLALDMAAKAERNPEYRLSPRQHAALVRIARAYRGCLRQDVRAIAGILFSRLK